MKTDKPSPTVQMYRTRGPISEWLLRDDQLSAWLAVYPKLDVLGECRKAWAWLEASPERRKTAKGMPRFLVGWLNRAERDMPINSASRRGQAPARAEWRADCEAMHRPTCGSYAQHQLRQEIQTAGCPHDGVCLTFGECHAKA